jgi:tRNA nucleotidyltransferase (CCA-adding enzyme)
MKGRRAEQMISPVTAYMTRKVVTIPPDTAVRVIEHIIYNHNIGHLPVTDGNKILGIITRSDLLDYMTHRKKRDEIIMANFCAVEPDNESCK